MTKSSKNSLFILLWAVTNFCSAQVSLNVHQHKAESTFYIPHFDYFLQVDTMVYKSRGTENIQASINLTNSIPFQRNNKTFFLDKTDKLSIVIDSLNNMTFTSKYPGNYIFYDSLKAIYNLPVLRSTPDLNLLISIRQKTFHDNLQLLEDFQRKHKTSPDFDEYIKSEVYFLNYQNVYAPIFNKKLQGASIPDDYFSEVNQAYIFTNSAFNSRAYQDFIQKFVEFYADTSGTKAGLQKLVSIIDFIDSKFDTPHQEWLKIGFLKSYSRRIKPQETVAFYEIVDKVEASLSDAGYKRLCKKIMSFINRYPVSIPDEVLNYKLLTTSNNEISLQQILDANKGKVIYVDFWATWCGPCVEMLPYSKKLKSIPTGKDIKVVYISLDYTADAWQKGLKKYELLAEQNFLLSKVGEPSLIEKYFNVDSIPRYLIIDKEGKLINANAPRPDRVSLLEGIIGLLNN